MIGDGQLKIRHSIFLKLLLVFVFLISLPVILIETFTYTKWTDATRDLISEQFEARFQQASGELQFALTELESLNDLIYEEARSENNLVFKQLLTHKTNDDLRNDTYSTSFLDELSKRIFAQYRDEVTFSLLSMDGRRLYQSSRDEKPYPVGYFSESYADLEWFQHIVSNGAVNSVLIGHESFLAEQEDRKYVSFGQVIRHPDNLQELVVSILSVPVTVFDKLWKSGNEQKLFYVRASDSIGHVIYTNVEKNEPAELQPSPDQPFIQAIIRPYGIVLEASVLDKYLVRPYLASIVQINLILIIFTIICITLFVMYAIYKIKPIYTLARKMSKAKQGDFVVQMSYKSPDELGMLTRTFNEMTVEINRLFRAKEQEYNEKLTILRLSLETRINPHFIYNMLDFIQYQVGEKDAETVSDMIISLSHILRYTIDNPGEPVLLETEMRWLNDYLHLQKQLHGGEVDIVIDATEETQECIVDKLILQPLIENCFVHGFEDRSRIYRLEIHIELSEDNLIITLRDNGKGFAASMDLVLDRNHCELFPQAGVGLSVTLQRFLLTHDNRTIKIKSTPGHGTEITLIQTACKNV